MASFQHPFQCLQNANQQPTGSAGILVASAGRNIYTYAVDNGKCLDVWPKNVQSSAEHAADEQAPPEKKIKLSPGPDGLNEEPKGKYSSKKNAGKQSPEWSNIPILLTSFDGKHVIALTAEDKTIRVFSLSQEGKLEELSSRYVKAFAFSFVLYTFQVRKY